MFKDKNYKTIPENMASFQNNFGINSYIESSANMMDSMERFRETDILFCKQLMEDVAVFSAYAEQLKQKSPVGGERYQMVVDEYMKQRIAQLRRMNPW